MDAFGLDQLPSLQQGSRLSEQLADTLALSIRERQLQPGQRLPPESALVKRFGVSRAVVREALSRLKTLGLIESRQGSGAFVKAVAPAGLDALARSNDGSVAAVLQMVEVRRALETESAGLAAVRRSPAALKQIRQALAAIDEAVRRGGDGVEEDVAFHEAIARAAENPYLLATLGYLNHFLLDATRVTRANEATRVELEEEVRTEHAAIVSAIEARDPVAARQAGATHMVHAGERIGRADASFWASGGLVLAQRLRAELGSHILPLDDRLAAVPSRPR